MVDWKPLLLWLQEYSLTRGVKEGTELWNLLPKGSEVFLLSVTCLQRLLDIVSAVQSIADLDGALADFRIDNSDIVEKRRLRSGLHPVRDFEVVAETVYRNIFARFAPTSEQELSAFIVWDGMLRPALLCLPYEIACVFVYGQQRVIDEIQLEGNISLGMLRERLRRTHPLQLDAPVDMTIWNVRHSRSVDDAKATLGDASDLSAFPWLTPVSAGDETKALQALTAKVIVVEFAQPRSFLSKMFSYIYSEKVHLKGIQNLHKNCYLSSVLQCLVRAYPFQMHYSGKPPRPTDKAIVQEIKAAVLALHEANSESFCPQELCSLLQAESPSFSAYKHADAHECLQAILSMLDLRTAEKPALLALFADEALRDEREWLQHLSSSCFTTGDLFGGLTKNELRCGACAHTSATFVPFTTFSLYLPAVRTSCITMVSLNPREAPTQFYIQSNTPVEHNETIGMLWQHIADFKKIPNFMIGEFRNKLFRGPLGQNNLAVQSSYAILELPAASSNHLAILVDIYSVSGVDEKPIATRVVSMPEYTSLEVMHDRVISWLVDIELGGHTLRQQIAGLIDTQVTPQELFRRMKTTSQINLITLDSSDLAVSDAVFPSLEGVSTVGELCRVKQGKIPRFKLTLSAISSDLVGVLQKFTPGQSYFFESLFRDDSESGTVLTLLQMLEYSLNDKPFNEEDCVECSACKKSTQHVISTSIVHLPRILVFALQRARLEASGLLKTAVAIGYPTRDLDLSAYEKGTRSDGAAIYDLKGVVHHRGQIDRGHYTAHALDPATGMWFSFDDNSAVSQDEDAAQDEKEAYLLFYVRKTSLTS